MRNCIIFFALLSIFALSCAGSGPSKSKIMEKIGRDILPTQQDYPDHGGVILYETEEIELELNHNYEMSISSNYEYAILYFNDKIEDWATQRIYLDKDRKLNSFSAHTIKPNGEILSLSMDDLYLDTINDGYNELSDDRSVKFTFPGVEPGAILEYRYSIIFKESFYSGDIWYIQSSLPKLYTKYQVEIPDIFIRSGLNWNYTAINTDLDQPEIVKNMLTQDSNLNRAKIYTWERRDVPALEKESYRPPYRDIAEHYRFDFRYKNWNEWSRRYWNAIDKYFNIEMNPECNELAKEITSGAETELEKIDKIFQYTQTNYRYVQTNVAEGKVIPNDASEIIENKYGDCKDMAVLNVLLLKACGIDAYPALVNTRDKTTRGTSIIGMDFNHMITLVKTSDGKEIWLDATGSSCNTGEIYSSIEDTDALVIYENGESEYIHIPPSKYTENALIRDAELEIHDDKSMTGKATLTFTGNENTRIRTLLKDANDSDVQKIIERYVNNNTPDLTVSNIDFKNKAFSDTFQINFDFQKDKIGSTAGKLLIFKPTIFTIESELDNLPDTKRHYFLDMNYPNQLVDQCVIHYDTTKFVLESLCKPFHHDDKTSLFQLSAKDQAPGVIDVSRKLALKKYKISHFEYDIYRQAHKQVANANDENLILKTRSLY